MDNCTNAFYIYLVSMILLYLTKPECLFYHKNKKCFIKKFGCGKNKTILSIHTTAILLAIFYYILVSTLNKLNINY